MKKNDTDNDSGELEKKKYRLEIAKLILFTVGSVIVFILINFPNSIFNKTKTNEDIRREKVRLIMEALKISDPLDKCEAILLIMDYYPEENVKATNNTQYYLYQIYDLRFKKEYWNRRLLENKNTTDQRICLSNLQIINKKIDDFIINNVNQQKIGKTITQ